MVRDGFRGVMSDLAETIRRVFQAPSTHAVPLGFPIPVSTGMPPMTPVAVEPPSRFEPELRAEPCLQAGGAVTAPMAWTARVQGEPGWAAWSTGANVMALPLLSADKTRRMEVPALPRRARARQQVLEALATRTHAGWSAFPAPPVRSLRSQWPAPNVHAGLAGMLEVPLAVIGEDLQKISKALWMRYTLQLVRSTGQNIRNLEVLGLYRIPAKGTRQVHHDPATGRLLVTLGPEAAGAKRAPFILARQKDDNAVVCCFVEEG